MKSLGCMLRDVDQILFTSRTGEILRQGELISSLPMNTKKEKKLEQIFIDMCNLLSVLFVEDLGN